MMRRISACIAGLLLSGHLAWAAPAVEPVTYPLITFNNVSGNPVGVTGGNYVLYLSGTYGGTTVSLVVTTNGVTRTYDTWTSTPSTAPCFAIPSGSVVQATLTGGTPSNMNVALGGVGSGGCATSSGGGVASEVSIDQGTPGTTNGVVVNSSALPTGAATAARQDTGNTSIAAVATAAGAPADSSCGSDAGTCSLIAIIKRLAASITTLNGKIDTLTTAVNASVPGGANDIGQFTPTYSSPVSGTTSAMTGTTSTQLFAAPGSGLKNYLTAIVCWNSHASVDTGVSIQDGSGGTVLASIPAAKVYGGAVVSLPTPLPQPTANTGLYVVNETTGASVKCSGVGFKR